jgi:hypothetical protein
MNLQSVSRSIGSSKDTKQVRDAAVFVSLSANIAAANIKAAMRSRIRAPGLWSCAWADRFKGL